ncbi:MAG: nucleotidyltransferase family protein [Ethanoligenens sp.]
MQVAGVIAEFNPFHNGHAHLLREAHRTGADAVAVVMSGCFTQRGEPACMSPTTRCAAALHAGADLVVELPLPWAMAAADTFAAGAISLLKALGCVDRLVFGSETGDTDKLTECVRMLNEVDGSSAFADALAAGCSFPRARQNAVHILFPQADISPLSRPNDTLALAYLNACAKLKAPFNPFAVRRVFAGHDTVGEEAGFSSAAQVRALLTAGREEKALACVPEQAAVLYRRALAAGAAPYRAAYAERAVLARLRCLDAAALARVPDVSEGLENRLLSAVHRASGLEPLFSAIKSKRYTLARVRRVVWGAFLGLSRTHTAAPPPYLRILGIGPRGRDILRRAGQTGSLPIVTRHADVAGLGTFARHVYELECRANDLYGLFLPCVQPTGMLQRTELIHVQTLQNRPK